MVSRMALRSGVMAVAGAPAGIRTPVQVISSKSGMPCAFKVGISGVSL